MADSVWVPSLASTDSSATNKPRHSALVRVTHWVITFCFFALLVTGIEILISHPRFYWGETGNVLTPALFQLPIPASRGAVKTGYSFVLKDQNSWSRALHFQAAWLVVFAGLLYGVSGLLSGHFRKNLLPAKADRSWQVLAKEMAAHLRFRRPVGAESAPYNVLQRMAYLSVIFFLFPLMIWTGLAMSPAFTATFPFTVEVFGGQQSARTIHFFATVALVLFLLVHVLMVWLAGFGKMMRVMTTGRASQHKEHS